jgi:hypothetical protein
MKHIYHCTPKELDEQDIYKTELHFQIWSMENKKKWKENKRLEQKQKLNK